MKPAFTVLELVIVIAVLALVVGLSGVAVGKSKQTAEINATEGYCKEINLARERATLDGVDSVALHGNDVNAAVNFLIDNNYLRHPAQ